MLQSKAQHDVHVCLSLAKGFGDASVESRQDTWGSAAPGDWEGFKEGCREMDPNCHRVQG